MQFFSRNFSKSLNYANKFSERPKGMSWGQGKRLSANKNLLDAPTIINRHSYNNQLYSARLIDCSTKPLHAGLSKMNQIMKSAKIYETVRSKKYFERPTITRNMRAMRIRQAVFKKMMSEKIVEIQNRHERNKE